MIQKSKRHSHQKPGLTLEVHQHLAQQRYWHHRLVVCSIGALTGAMIGWLASLGLAAHWMALGAGFLLAFFIPVPRSEPWALSWIRNQIGLSYEAALESQPDRYGFYDQLQARAKNQLKKLELPSPQAWWLPVLVLAISLTLFPLIPRTFATNPLGNTGISSSTPPAPQANESVSPQPQSATPAETPSLAEATEPQGHSTNDQSLNSSLNQGGDSANRDNQIADEEALSRFLETLERQRQQNPQTQPQVNPDMSPTRTSSGEQNQEPDQSRDQQTNPFERITEGEEGEVAPKPGQNQGENQQAAEPSNEESDTNQTQPGEAEQPDQENAEAQPEESERGSGGSGTPNQEGQEQALEEGSGDEAGFGGSLGQRNESQELEDASQQAPELLQGQITQGPQNSAGTVRLPNLSNDPAPASNTIALSFRPSDEEALTEGKIPLEYQNIIRNYFRY